MSRDDEDRAYELYRKVFEVVKLDRYGIKFDAYKDKVISADLVIALGVRDGADPERKEPQPKDKVLEVHRELMERQAAYDEILKSARRQPDKSPRRT